MSDKERMTREIHEFVYGDMSWESAFDLITRIAQSEEWIVYLLEEMETLECA